MCGCLASETKKAGCIAPKMTVIVRGLCGGVRDAAVYLVNCEILKLTPFQAIKIHD